ncbi:hypothetical protein C5167_049987 [Papaver somniferum]|uniref:Peptidase S54 rhomboid domain-containing protein n=1 Tax=Papaver somniferum TaxID=3469 RepID=A0A4Y7KRI9_PAPSO|nr:hypothetical protein C5167_049987 [Papaver somniferum]
MGAVAGGEEKDIGAQIAPIIKLEKTGKVGLVMRQSKPFKICANHLEEEEEEGKDCPNLVFHDVFTPLQASIRTESWKCAEHLITEGADQNFGPEGVKDLLLAAPEGITQIVKLLVEAGGDPNVTNIHGLKPIEAVAVHNHRRTIEILLPVTSPIPSYVDWIINGIIKHVNSKEFEKKMTRKANETFLEEKSRGASALQRKEYWLAVYWYSEVSKTANQSILTCKSNRKSRVHTFTNLSKAGIRNLLMSPLFVQDIPEVGSSGALFGLLGEMLSGLIRNWKIYSDKFTSSVVLCGVIGILMVGGDKGNYIAVSILDPAIEIWDLNLGPLSMPEVYIIIKGTIGSNAEWALTEGEQKT